MGSSIYATGGQTFSRTLIIYQISTTLVYVGTTRLEIHFDSHYGSNKGTKCGVPVVPIAEN